MIESMIRLRPMTPDDIPSALALCREAGWNQLESDWQICLQRSPLDCRVAVRTDNIVGTVVPLRYSSAPLPDSNPFSWIGLVLVDPNSRRQGIGLQLLREALQILQDEKTVKLDATPAGREVYRKMNFVDEYPLRRMIATAPVIVPAIAAASTITPAPGSTTSPAVSLLWSAIQSFDREVFGADRLDLLLWMTESSPQYALYLQEGGNLAGYCLGRPGYHFTQIGPVIAKNDAIARQLVSTALLKSPGRPVVMDIPQDKPGWVRWLRTIGFEEQRPFMRMFRGSNTSPGQLRYQFAITGPEFG